MCTYYTVQHVRISSQPFYLSTRRDPNLDYTRRHEQTSPFSWSGSAQGELRFQMGAARGFISVPRRPSTLVFIFWNSDRTLYIPYHMHYDIVDFSFPRVSAVQSARMVFSKHPTKRLERWEFLERCTRLSNHILTEGFRLAGTDVLFSSPKTLPEDLGL